MGSKIRTMRCGHCWKRKTLLEKICAVSFVILVICIVLMVILIPALSVTCCLTPACINGSAHILDVVDMQRDPCDNFYEYACGNFENNFDVSTVSTVMGHTAKKIITELKSILQEDVSDEDCKSLRLQKKFYKACVDLEAIDGDSNWTFLGLIRRIGGWPVVEGEKWNASVFDFVNFTIGMRNAGLQSNWFLGVEVEASEDNSKRIIKITLPEPPNKVEVRSRRDYTSLLNGIATSFGATGPKAQVEMKDVLFFETRLSIIVDGLKNDTVIKKPPKLTISEIQSFWPKIDWTYFLSQMTRREVTGSTEVIFGVYSYLPKLDVLLRQNTRRTQANYAVWKLVEAYSAFLSKGVREEMAHFRSLPTNTLNRVWYTNRDKFCYDQSRFIFWHTMEHAYLRKFVNSKTRKNVQTMAALIQKKLGNALQESGWMDRVTVNHALSKLGDVSVVIGGTDEMFDNAAFDHKMGVEKMEFNTTNIIEMIAEATSKGLDSLYSSDSVESDLESWIYDLTPTFAAKFDRERNMMYIPAGMLHGIFYENDRPQYLNYGRLGVIIGHELVHGSDISSSYYKDKHWWSNETKENFLEAASCLIDDCNEGLSTDNETKVDCNSTLLENMADYTGVNLAYEAYQAWVAENGPEPGIPGVDLPGTQIFWVAYATLMCHAPISAGDHHHRFRHMVPSFRVVASFRNSPHFAEDFACPASSNMNPAEKCRIM